MPSAPDDLAARPRDLAVRSVELAGALHLLVVTTADHVAALRQPDAVGASLGDA